MTFLRFLVSPENVLCSVLALAAGIGAGNLIGSVAAAFWMALVAYLCAIATVVLLRERGGAR